MILAKPQSIDAIILSSVWRPINHPIEDWPLAVCDGSNVFEDDLLKTDYVTLDYIGETYNVLYRDKYNWHYLSRQTPEEVTLLKISDSNLTAKATCKSYLPSSAFCNI